MRPVIPEGVVLRALGGEAKNDLGQFGKSSGSLEELR
jgi:hypothetical protein